MQIQQLQVAFDARADRLTLRIATAEREEVQVALTRRLVKALWPHLQRMLEGHLAGTDVAAPIADASTPAVDRGSYAAPYDDADLAHPLGVEPLLAMESRLQPVDGPLCRVMLGEVRARQVTFDCDRDLMLALCAMIRATVDKADWGLDLDALGAAVTPAVPSENTPTIH